jgi:hypothetical protein
MRYPFPFFSFGDYDFISALCLGEMDGLTAFITITHPDIRFLFRKLYFYPAVAIQL